MTLFCNWKKKKEREECEFLEIWIFLEKQNNKKFLAGKKQDILGNQWQLNGKLSNNDNETNMIVQI